MRLTGNGNIDSSFGDAGLATFDLQTDGSLLPVVNDLVVGPDRNIVGAGGVCRPHDCWWSDAGFVVRLLGDGGHSPGVIGIKELDDVWVKEDDGEAVFNVRRTGGHAGSVGISWNTVSVQDGALSGQDFVAASGNLHWSDGDARTQQIRVPILADNIVEVPEVFDIVMRSQQDGAGLGKRRASVVIEADGAPHGQFAVYNTEASEFYPASIPVFRDYYSSGIVSVTVTPVAGTATAGADFVADPVVLTWADGESGWKEAVIPIVEDNQPEGPEMFTVQLSNATGGAVVGPASSATVQIVGNNRGRVDQKNPGGSGALGWLSLFGLGLLRLLRGFPRQG